MVGQLPPVVLRISIREDGTVQVWSSDTRPVGDVVTILRGIADKFEEGEAKRLS